MPETDRILEAEQSIQNIASELKRMRDAANLLQGAQAKADAVITSAERLVKETERFSGSCGAIIDKLSSTDLRRKLEGLEKLHAELESAKTELDTTIKKQNDRISKEILEESASVNSVLNTVDDRVGNLEKEILQLATEFKEFRQEQFRNVRGIKVRQVTTITLMVITSMMVLAIIFKMWVPALGG